MNLAELSTQELQDELERRKKDRTVPQPLPAFDVAPLRKICGEYIDSILAGEVDDEMTNYIFETAVECIYGTDVWYWVRACQR